MIIDCGECVVRGDACADCVVTFLTIPMRAPEPGEPAARAAPAAASGATAQGTAPRVDLDAGERSALEVLADSGLVPPLRLRRVV